MKTYTVEIEAYPKNL